MLIGVQSTIPKPVHTQRLSLSRRLHTTAWLLLQVPPSTQTLDALTLSHRILQEDPKALSSTQWTPDLVLSILKRLWNHGPKALQFFDHLDCHPSYAHPAAAFDHAIDIAARMRDYRTLWKLVARMRSRRLGPRPKTFAIITERYVSAGKPDKALKVFLSMHNHGCPHDSNSFNTFLDVLCKSGRAEMAYRLLKMLRGSRFRADIVTYNILAHGFCLIKQTPKAQDILKEMVWRGLTPTITTYNIMLKGFFRAGQIKEAWEFFLQMKKRKCEIDVVTYTTLVHGLGVVGEIDKALKMFNEMVGTDGILPSISTYNAFIQVLCKKDSMENAISVFEEMLRKGYVPNTMTYNSVIRGLCHRGRMNEAVQYLDKMRDDHKCEPNIQTYNVIVRYYCDQGEIEKALVVFDKMNCVDYCLPNLDTYNVLISSMFGRKKSDDLLVAGRLIVEMVGRGFLPRRFTFNRVLNGLLLTGNQHLAREILRLLSESGRLPRHFKL
ncbi:unnamed protein product [Cuscuta europaea]|uniref:Pentatricopeptide repeat-containing protein n=1 Tax=Cuscuta europaea TaxID=41803 RepID=A0A9P0ZVX9_CUSEU|nr:unnamed protein product [Cuscuta europaea]